jgi:hypothetical protein
VDFCTTSVIKFKGKTDALEDHDLKEGWCLSSLITTLI